MNDIPITTEDFMRDLDEALEVSAWLEKAMPKLASSPRIAMLSLGLVMVAINYRGHIKTATLEEGVESIKQLIDILAEHCHPLFTKELAKKEHVHAEG